MTERPLLSRTAPREAAATPLPSEETTPPVTNKNLVCFPSKTHLKRNVELLHNDGITG